MNNHRHVPCKGGAPGPPVRSPYAQVPANMKNLHPGLLKNIPPQVKKAFPFITDKTLQADDRHYLLTMASVYSVSRMKALKQDQYRHLLHKQYMLGKFIFNYD